MLFGEDQDLTARARITQAELMRAIRAAEACGKVALPSLESEATEVAECDRAFGVSR